MASLSRGLGSLRPEVGQDDQVVPLVVSDFVELDPSLSPDGCWLAYASNESGRFEVYVRPFPDTATGKWLVSTSQGGDPVWRRAFLPS